MKPTHSRLVDGEGRDRGDKEQREEEERSAEGVAAVLSVIIAPR